MSGMGPIIYIQNTSSNPVNNYKTPSQYHNNSSYNPIDDQMVHYKNSAGQGPIKIKGNSLVILPTNASKGPAAPTTQSQGAPGPHIQSPKSQTSGKIDEKNQLSHPPQPKHVSSIYDQFLQDESISADKRAP